MKITSYKKWIAVALLSLVSAFGLSAQTASFTTTTTNFDPAGGMVTFDVSFDYTGQSLSTLGVNIALPDGWSFASASGSNVPPIVPDSGTTSAAEFAYFSIPSNSLSFSVVLNYGSGLTTDQSILGQILYKISGNSTELNAALGPVTVAAPPEAPSFNVDPVSITVDEGMFAEFAAAAAGNPAPTYQWKKDGADIDGATSSDFIISSASPADAGSYTVVATNSEGSVTSAAATLTVNEAPMITAQPESATVILGGSATFSVTATGAVSYQWRRDGQELSGETDATLSIFGVESPQNGQTYDVLVTNSVTTVTSDLATLTVIEPPTIHTQPMTQTANEGDTVTLVVGAIGTDPLTFQWSKDGTPISGPAATDSSFEISSVTREDAGGYSVTINNAAGEQISETAVLTVNFAALITAQPTDQTSGAGGTVIFSVTAEGSPLPTYQWRRDGQELSGETGPTLTLNGVEPPQNGQMYDVIVTNSVGTDTSSEATLTVNEGPAINTQPQSASVEVGNVASFQVSASGNPTPTYQWKKDGVDITGETSDTLTFSSVTKADDAEYSVVVTNEVDEVTSVAADLEVLYAPEIMTQPTDQTSGAGGTVVFSVEADGSPSPTYLWRRDGQNLSTETGPTLTLNGVEPQQNGQMYDVIVTNSVGMVTSSEATLTVNEGPAITTQPESTTVSENSPASFMVIASGNPTPTYQWMKGGVEISGATEATFSITSTERANSGDYTVTVTNSIDAVTSAPATLDVLFKPEITVQPTDMTIGVGGSVTFDVDGDSNPEPTFQWFRGDSPISGATGGELTLDNLQLSDDGATFFLRAINSEGEVDTDTVTLTVNEGAAITSQPVSATVIEDQPSSFLVVATGNPAPTYQWKLDGVDIDGATDEIYSTSVTKRAQSGEYTVVVDNGVGTVTSDIATLDVQYAPEFTRQPSNMAVGVGSTVTFDSDGVANPEPSLQWFRGDSPVESADGELVLTDVQLSDSGSTFHLVVTNSLGEITSETVTLTVREIPAITLQPVGGTENAGGSFTFTVDATGTPTPTYQWRKGGSEISGATSSSLTLSSLEGTDAGDYDVVVSNAQGSVTSSAATLVVPTPPTITSDPVGGKRVVGESFTFSVSAIGTDPLSYQWKKDGTDVAGATSATLTVSPLAVEDAGSYTATVSNAIGSATSAGAALEVDKALKVPTFTTHPANTSVRTGEATSLTVAVAGNPIPTVQWFKNNAAISGQTGMSLSIPDAQEADQASYHVVATNTEGTAKSSVARVTVTTADTAPVITSQPRGQTVVKDDSVTFTVVATGVPEPTYQWRLNSVAITGATSAAYTIDSAAESDAGTYSVVVTNSVGSVTSQNAILGYITKSFPGFYFGSFGEGRGSFAVRIKRDNTGTFLGFDKLAGLYIRGSVTVAADGSFTLQIDTTPPAGSASVREGSADQAVGGGTLPGAARDIVEFSAKISPDGSVAGTVTGVEGLSMTAMKEEGTSESAGFYQASSDGTDDITYTIVAPSGKVLLVTRTSDGEDGGVGSANESGAITVLTVNDSMVSATVSVATEEITTEVTDSGGATKTFSGGSSEVIATQRLVNISSRAVAGADNEQTIAGLVITGEDSKTVLIRAIGPGLADFNVTGVLSAPKLELFQGQTSMASNTGWSTASNTAEVVAAAASVGAFALDAANADSVLLETLAPGAYTAVASGSDGGTGVVLIEVYDLSAPAAGQKLFNISTRAAVGSGDSTVVAGFVVSGTVPKRVLLRGAGPALAGFGLTDALADPQIKLFKGQTEVASNDDWGVNAAAVTEASTTTGAFQFAADSKDSAMVLSLEPGAYTLQMSGVGAEAGIGLIEVYEIP